MRIALAWVDMSDPTDRAVVQGLSRELRRRGHAVCIVGPKRRAGEPFREVVGGVPVYRVGSARELLEIDSQEAVDVWHCHVFARDHRIFIEATRRARWPLLVTLHLIMKDYLRFVGGVSGLRRLIAPARRVVLVDGAARSEFLRSIPGWRRRSSVVYNGAPVPSGAAVAPKGIRKPYILSIGRLAPYKGQDILLMAFAKMLEKHPGLMLVLCGRDQSGGATKAFARALRLERSVIFTGELSPVQVRGLLKGCESFVLPSRRENFPLALLEAMGAGKAVVASASGGVPEMLRHGRDGFLVPPNDVGALSRRMLELCASSDLRKRLGRSARIRSRRFSWDRAAAEYCRLYRDALARRRSSFGMRLKK